MQAGFLKDGKILEKEGNLEFTNSNLSLQRLLKRYYATRALGRLKRG